jgi:hypothetical protein
MVKVTSRFPLAGKEKTSAILQPHLAQDGTISGQAAVFFDGYEDEDENDYVMCAPCVST